MDLSLFQYSFPKELVAQHPLPERDASRMMVLDRASESLKHESVKNLPDYLREGDVLVLNDTKVFPARLVGEMWNGELGMRNVEILLLEPLTQYVQHNMGVLKNAGDSRKWRCLAKPFRKIRAGQIIDFGEDLQGTILNKSKEDLEIWFEGEEILEKIEAVGFPPLPPYIRRKKSEDYTDEDRKRYQTVFAKNLGSAAAPTAALHFSEKLLEAIRARGVHMAHCTLHISTDTFLPIREEDITKHKMHGERFCVPEGTRVLVRAAKKEGRRVIAVGTTVVRALESDWDQETTRLYITPGFCFKIVDGLLTNFHQPGSTLLVLTSAFADREFLLQAYSEAVRERYRLFSYGDCMLIL